MKSFIFRKTDINPKMPLDSQLYFAFRKWLQEQTVAKAARGFRNTLHTMIVDIDYVIDNNKYFVEGYENQRVFLVQARALQSYYVKHRDAGNYWDQKTLSIGMTRQKQTTS